MPAGGKVEFPYTDEWAEKICDEIANSRYGLITICEQQGYPTRSTVNHWLAKPEYASFQAQYARARELQADLLDHEIQKEVDIADVESVPLAKLRAETMRWRAGRLNPKRYGERQILQGDSTADPIRHQADVGKTVNDIINQLTASKSSIG